MKIMIATFLVLASLPALAEDAPASPCVQAFKHVNDTYFTRARDLESKTGTGIIGAIGSAIVWGGCLKAAHSLAGCTVFAGGTAAVAALYGWESHQDLSQLEDVQYLYQVYLGTDREDVESFAHDVKAPAEEAQAALTGLMDSGDLCRANIPMDYDSAVQRVREEIAN